jgi:hypothetical protein
MQRQLQHVKAKTEMVPFFFDQILFARHRNNYREISDSIVYIYFIYDSLLDCCDGEGRSSQRAIVIAWR